MAYPPGVITRQVILPQVMGLNGQPAVGLATMTSSVALQWDATNQIILNDADTKPLVNGSVVFDLPIVQSGFTGPHDVRVDAWIYTISVEANGVSIPVFEFLLPAGEGPYYLDVNSPTNVTGTILRTIEIQNVGTEGPPGPANSLEIGTVETVIGLADAEIVGDPPNQFLNLQLPKGETGPASTVAGPPGPVTDLTIGTVTTLSSGSTATASITGTAPTKQLNLGLPQGVAGSPGDLVGMPTGGTTGQIIRKNSATNYDATWQNIPEQHDLPVGGSVGQILEKTAAGDRVVGWRAKPVEVPSGGLAFDVLRKNSANSGFEWAAVTSVPSGGTAGQVLKRDSGGNLVWATDEVGAQVTELPAGGSAGQVLKKAQDGTTLIWASDLVGATFPTGGTAGQVLKKGPDGTTLIWAADELGSGGGGASEVSSLAAHGAVNDGLSASPTDNRVAFEQTVADAGDHGVIWIDEGYYYVNSAQIGDQDLYFDGPGYLVQGEAPLFSVTRPFGNPVPVTSVSTHQLGTADRNILGKLVTGSVTGIKQGDVLHLSADERYSYTDDGTQGVYKAAYVPVHGLAINIGSIQNGGVSTLETIEGVTSGARGTVYAITVNGTTSTLTFAEITNGAFQLNESVRILGGSTVRGTVTEVASIIAARRLVDTYPTSGTNYRTTSKAHFEGHIQVTATKSPYTAGVLAAQRKPTIILRGQIDGDLHVRCKGTWTRFVRLEGCYGFSVSGTIRNLPNIAETTIMGYGYGVEFLGLTDSCVAHDLKGRNLRHLTTTNTVENTSLGAASLYTIGVPKYNVTKHCVATDPLAAGFDTHDYTYFHSFIGCLVVHMNPGGRHLTNSAGYQNRGWGTLYDSCGARGVVSGWHDGTFTKVAPFLNTISHRNCWVEDYQAVGFNQSNNTNNSAGLTKYEYLYCSAEGNDRTEFFQYGFAFDDVTTLAVGCTSRRFNGVPYRINSKTNTKVRMVDCIADYTYSSASNSGIRFDGGTASGKHSIVGLKIICRPDGVRPISAFRFAGAGAITLEYYGIVIIGGDGSQVLSEVTGATPILSVCPVFGGSSSGGGSTFTPAFSNALAGSMFTLFKNETTQAWPTRPSTRSDIIFDWTGTAGNDPARNTTGGAYPGVDRRTVVVTTP